MARAHPHPPAADGAQDALNETAPLLVVRDLRTYLTTKAGIVKAVDGVSFHLRAGETLGIVGESGSGKSMTARSILRMEPQPAAEIVGGEVLLNGEDLLSKTEEEMRAVRGKRISMILQDPQTSLNPVFTVGNQIMEAVRIHDERKSDRPTLQRRVVDLLRQVNVAAPEKRVGDYPHEMSGGMKQRVVGAIAISSEPDIIIADEPTTSLDLTIQAQYLRLLKEIQRRTGAAIIFITHDFGIVARMCDRVAVMYAGRIVEQGDVRAIFNQPSHPYTHALIHSVPQVERRVKRLFTIPGQPPLPGMEFQGCPFADRCAYVDERCRQEHPPAFAGRSGNAGHAAECWRLEDPSWQPNPYSA
jgi:oligopeptide/dipeptide ABC transporter ATP-binding protein